LRTFAGFAVEIPENRKERKGLAKDANNIGP
jgi:hypothetical protein